MAGAGAGGDATTQMIYELRITNYELDYAD